VRRLTPDRPARAVGGDSALEQRAGSERDRRDRILFVIARNLVAVVGVLLLGWSAQNLIVLYFADTLGAMWAIFTAVALHFSGIRVPQPFWQRLNAIGGVLIATFFLTAFMAVPLGVPVLILLMSADWSYQAALADESFILGLATIALLSLLGMMRHLMAMPADIVEDSPIKREFAIVITRWVLIIVLILSIAVLLGDLGPYLLVIGYAIATVVSEVYPDRFSNLFGDRGHKKQNPPD
jgi:hypothetical protein